MSRVYRATRRHDGRVVAVKSVGLASDDVAWAERRGAELQRQFHAVDTRVPDVLDIRAGTHELIIEMEYIDGEDLSTVLRARGRFTPNDAVEVSAALADVLDRAHQFVAVVDGETYHGIVHGDLKPRNIRVCVEADACAPGRADARLARAGARLRRRQGHPRRRRRDAQRLRQRALHVAGAPDRRPRQRDERLLVARRRAVRAAGRRAALPGQRARRAAADRQRAAGAAGRLPGRSRGAGPSPAGPRSGACG